MIVLDRYFSRQRSLFHCYIWDKSNATDFKKWIGANIKYRLFTSEGANGKINVYYDIEETNEFWKRVWKKVVTEPGFFEKVNKAFYKEWKILLPYASGEKEIKNIDDLEKYYNAYLKWWAPMAINFNIPDLIDIPEKFKNGALKIREEIERPKADVDTLFLNFFLMKYPEYKEIARVLLPKEIFGLKKKPLSDVQIKNIKKRLNGYFMLDSKLYPLDQLDRILKNKKITLYKTEDKNIKEIKGTSASKGYAKGKVRLVLYANDISKLKAGEILVTEMTLPAFVPYMKTAAAFITDEGGLTCHAAIVSREMKKPCIIGTKIATQVLKDGDMVEVDANNGVVRILG